MVAKRSWPLSLDKVGISGHFCYLCFPLLLEGLLKGSIYFLRYIYLLWGKGERESQAHFSLSPCGAQSHSLKIMTPVGTKSWISRQLLHQVPQGLKLFTK